MYYCYVKEENYIIGVASSETPFSECVSKSKAENIKRLFMAKPEDPAGYVYKLRADNLEWELVEKPPVPDPDLSDEEIVDILLGGVTE